MSENDEHVVDFKKGPHTVPLLKCQASVTWKMRPKETMLEFTLKKKQKNFTVTYKMNNSIENVSLRRSCVTVSEI